MDEFNLSLLKFHSISFHFDSSVSIQINMSLELVIRIRALEEKPHVCLVGINPHIWPDTRIVLVWLGIEPHTGPKH